MSKKWKLPAPIVVVAIIALCWVGFLLWPSITRQDAADDTPSQQALFAGEADPSPGSEAAEGPGAPDAPVPAVANVEVEYADAAWSTYHGGPALTGAVKAVLPEAPVVLWRFQADAPVYHTPVSCGERIYFSTAKGGVFALDLEGNEIWSKHPVRGTKKDGTPRMERFDAPTACFDGTVLIGAMSGTLYAFDGATGDEKWRYDVGGPILGTVNIHRSAEAGVANRVYVIGQNDGTLHGIELESGTRTWKAEAIDRCDGSPSIGGDAIIFGSCAAALHVFSAQDGKLTKNIPIDDDSQITGGVAIVGDSVFPGSRSGYLIHANFKTGEVVWINKDSEDEVFSTPAVSGEWVV
ncbi:MAG: PQQ-binding-like beta-propeller repeat protein, partial [Candidatus Hydrogenedentes bacterium]|nr:PQQ-binding-like beta-propeller repeat protein [Candidatus Hydrogenedentota bacterium]